MKQSVQAIYNYRDNKEAAEKAKENLEKQFKKAEDIGESVLCFDPIKMKAVKVKSWDVRLEKYPVVDNGTINVFWYDVVSTMILEED